MGRFILPFMKKRHSPEEEASQMNFGLARVYKYEELKKATNNFDKELGKGGYGRVYLGKLQDGKMVAVKVLCDDNPKRLEQFFNEVTVLSRLHHKNLVSLYGCTHPCRQELLLVYEYVSNGTVADHLHKKRTTLTWATRVQIAVETAEALEHLHALNPLIIHRDVNTSNILLDDDFHAKVADLGICRLLPSDSTHVLTEPQGTLGYRDPEYQNYFRLTDKTDVYSFGVVLMELISGQQAVDVDRAPEGIYLVDWILNKKPDEFVDPILGYHTNNDVRRMIDSVAELAIDCLQLKGDMRPPMLHILTVLKRIQNEKHPMEHRDGRQEEIHAKGIQHEKQQKDTNSFDPQQELRDESLNEIYRGVEEAKTDCKSRVVVKGKEVDPIRLCDTVQNKAGRKVELISPLPNPPEEEEKEETKDPTPEVKKEEPKPNTVLLKIRMHCEECAQDLKKQIKKTEGVESVVTDLPNHQVIVKGFVDPGNLVKSIYRRTGKQAAIVQEEEKQDEESEKKEENTEQEKQDKEPEKKEENTRESEETEKKEENTGEEKKEEDGIKVAVVKGKEADPIKLCDTVQKKAGRKVELISPLPNPPEEEKKEETKDPPPEVKMEEPKPNTVLLKIQMHCEGCAQDLKRRIKKIEGIESVVTDLPNHQVIVKGFVDLGKLVENIYKRTGKQAAIVQEEEPEKKEENTEEKQDEEPEKKEKITEVQKKAEESEKREESTTKEKKKKESESRESKKKEENTGEEKKEEDGIKVDDKELEYRPPIRSPPQMFQGYARLPSPEAYARLPPPPPQMFEEDAHQMFSDENPNACSLM